MKYYVVADIHGFYDEFITALKEKGYFTDSQPHKLIICGDLFDRGTQALELQSFVLDLLSKDEVILIRGNHEDLAMDLLHGWTQSSYLERHHTTNGTLDTVMQLTESDWGELKYAPERVGKRFLQTPYMQMILPAMRDYFETARFIFVHGWIPCTRVKLSLYLTHYVPIDNWRDADQEAWDRARWINGMEAANGGVLEEGKTIVCGHWHCSFGHARYEGKGGEFDNNPDFTPYYGRGVIALDACTVLSGKVNCIVVEDK